MTYWFPDTCLCVSHVETKTLIVKCTNHNTFNSMIAANRAENLRHGSNPTAAQQKIIAENKALLKQSSTRTAAEKSKFLDFKLKSENAIENEKMIKKFSEKK